MSWRLISNVIEIAKIKNQNVFLVIVDTEKAFDSFDHNFLIFTLENYGFGKNVKDLVWVKILLRDQESCVIYGHITTRYPSLGRGAQQGHPKSAFVVILASEILFLLIKSKPEIEGIILFDYYICDYYKTTFVPVLMIKPFS